MAEATVSKKTYLSVAAVLMVLLGMAWGVSYLPLSPALSVVAALAIAGAKMLLIMLYFMHVRYSSRTTVVVAAAIFMWVVILFALTFSDYLTRGWLGPAYTPGERVEEEVQRPMLPPDAPGMDDER